MADRSSGASDPFETLGRALSTLVGSADIVEPHRLIELVDRCAVLLGGSSAAVWLVDHQQRALVHLAPAGAEDRVPVDGSMAGRAFTTGEVVQVDDGGGAHLWVPLLTGVERIGVLEVVTAGELAVDRLRDFAAVVAAAIVASDRYTDLFTRTRRQEPMTLAAELQWASLPR